MNSFIFYNSYNIFINRANNDKLDKMPGGKLFTAYFHIFSRNITAIDRTHNVSIPLKTKLYPHLEMPQFVKFDKSFEEVCDERARFLLNKAKQDNRKIAVMYSGGVDSTLILVSFLKNATKEELKNIIVLLSDSSIRENTNFYYNFVIKNFTCVSSFRFPYLLGNDKYLMVSGENADQLFGSQVNDNYIRNSPYSDLFRPIDEVKDRIIYWFRQKIEDDYNRVYAEDIFDLFKRIVDNAPIPLENTYKFFWWINFVTKWQSVYVRILAYAVNKKGIKVEENYTTFYSPAEFQLWAMNNTDSFVREEPGTTKYVPKEIICDFTKDYSYMKKPKIGSLSTIVKQKEMSYGLYEDMSHAEEYPGEEHYNYGNDFEKLMNR
jgi:hypothetical protein